MCVLSVDLSFSLPQNFVENVQNGCRYWRQFFYFLKCIPYDTHTAYRTSYMRSHRFKKSKKEI